MSKMLKEISFREPTEAQLRAGSAEWLERVGDCFIDQWPSDLLAISAPTIFIPMPQDSTGLFEPKTFHAIADDLAAEIDATIGWDRKFFRLNSRSPKDALWPFEAAVSCSGKEIMGIISTSNRMLDDLCYFKYSTAIPKLCLREYLHGVRPEREYRCFIKDGETLAVAEYKNRFEQFESDASFDAQLRPRIDSYLADEVKPRLHINTVVVDLAFTYGGLKLLEINPYGLSDPVGAVSYRAIENGIHGIARLLPPLPTLSEEKEG